MNTPNTPESGGQGSEPMSRSEMALVRHAIRERWNVPEAVRQVLFVEALKIARDPRAKRRDKTAAMKLLLSMDALNLNWAKFEVEQNVDMEVGDYAVDLSDTPTEDDPGQ